MVDSNLESNEIVDLVHSLVLQSRPQPSSTSIGFDDPLTSTSAPSKIKIKSVPNSPCNNLSRTQSLPVRKKVQIKSAPLKPPDIGSSSLFPSVEESASLYSPVPKRIPLKSSSSNSSIVSNSFANNENSSENVFSLARDQKFKTLEAKLTEPLLRRQQSEDVSSPSPISHNRRASFNISELPTTPSRKTPRSAKLFSELSSERRQHLDELAGNYAKSIDSNQCRNILDELEFLFQLFNTSVMTTSSSFNSIVKISNGSTASATSAPLLCNAAEQAYFVIKVVISQLDKLFVSIPPYVPQLIIDNYPHKIPKPVRKHIEDWIAKEKENILKRASTAISNVNENIPLDLVKTVTFQSEKDGRANFLHQTDFHAFCKQRDLFYSIRESWTNTGNNGGPSSSSGMIMDRNKARMSFPPPAPIAGTSGSGGGSSSSNSARFVDSVPFKVQSLFQMNRNPTNLFHMASLFVSHYLLEARAQEVGGMPKDDTMKEFFQSNPTKLQQLNSRFSMNDVAETLEESGTQLAFQKQFLLASSPKFVQHVVDRLVMEITKVEGQMESVDLSTSPTQICRTVKDSVHLARLLGFAHFLPYLPDETKQHNSNNIPINSIEKETVLQEQVQLRSYHLPPMDLKSLLEKARQSGRLTTTCPWIIEYLLQCDPVTLLLPSYQHILKILLCLYKNVFVMGASGETDSSLALSNRNFLRFHLGTLFSYRNFPDTVFALLKSQELVGSVEWIDNGASNVVVGQEGLVDLQEEVARSLVDFFFEETFSRFKRILSWGKLEVSHPAITGEFRHIRPIPASSSSYSDSKRSTVTTLSKEKILQSQLEATFFELYPPAVKRSVDFIAERMAANFVNIAKVQLFPNCRTVLQNQGIFGVRAAEKCRMKIGEEMNKYLNERCYVAAKLFLEQNVTPGVLALCQKIAVRKARETGSEWIKNYISAAMFPDVGLGTEGENKTGTQSSAPSPVKPPVAEDPPFEILILVHRTLRKLNSLEQIDPQVVDKILACQSLSKAPWTFIPLIDWGLSLITFQPQVLNPVRTKQLVTHWKNLWNPSASKKVLNPRNLLLIAKSKNSRDSWIKLGSITQHLIAEGLMKAEDLEQQCMQLLSEEWPDQVHKRISEFLTIVLEAFHERSEYHVSESAQILDWVAWICSGQPDQD